MLLPLLLPLLSLRLARAAFEADFTDPRLANGSWVTAQAEPLNVVVSAQSSRELREEDVLQDWLNSLGYADECLGLHAGGPQQANLGDGNGYVNQTGLYRWAYGLPEHAGSCWESLVGGSHVRYWFQGDRDERGAIFLAASDEHNISMYHDIVDNGYDLGRDNVAGNATVPSGTISPSSGTIYLTTVEMASGFFEAGLTVNGVAINHEIGIDGLVAVLTITISEETSNELSLISFFILAAFVLSTLLGGWASYYALRPSSEYSTLRIDARKPDIHDRRHQQLLLALEQARRAIRASTLHDEAELGLRDQYETELR
ncbi:hypothetical protein BCR35DRAFT_351947 [Leucosporidium creatinivorum]|uniref:Uncharacterized protein n=1 Tax=Leucosporidium creatinivorum TaxID=106004 RepID=A0A1Y2FL20_9BASI|nr:hypothetical protein BCR35DRAFT_351947 [Leucosporidium creatinivorum]